MIQVAKWILFDSQSENYEMHLRFDELTKIIQDGSVHETDLIRSPNEGMFTPAKYCAALNYYLLKRKQYETMNPMESRDQVFTNERIMKEREGESEHEEHNRMKRILFEKFQKQVFLLLDRKEIILYLALPFGSMIKPSKGPGETKAKYKKRRSLIVFTDKRILKLCFDHEMKYLSDIKFYLYEKIETFCWKEEFFSKKSLNIFLNSGEVLQWKGLKIYEMQKISLFLFPYIEWSKKLSKQDVPDFLKDTRTVEIEPIDFNDENEQEPVTDKPDAVKEKIPAKDPMERSNRWRIPAELILLVLLFFIAVKFHFENYIAAMMILGVVFFIELFLAKAFFMRQGA